MKKIVGGKENSCRFCGGTMVYLKIKGLGVVSNCRQCGSIESGRAKDEVKIYTYSEER